MKKFLCFLGVCVLFTVQLLAQSSTHTISGIVKDEITQEPVGFASVRFLNPSDSTYIMGATTNEQGKFRIVVKPSSYIMHISYLGYIDYYKNINPTKNITLETIFIKEDAVYLNEAIVEAKAIEIMVKGDTVEYNADSYKVQESAVVEDLLKKMPGVEIDEEGKITVNGKEVKKIMVDGKEFFSRDPKIASKNLPAMMVDKLQVLDQKSDMSLMTGFDDGNEETVINLTIKKGMKEGVFGNALAGYGNKERYEGSGMVNYMRNNTQMTALGGINNTNNAGGSDLGAAMFGNSGGGGRPRGLRFGGRDGVAKNINGGFNFATEYSDKLKWGGDVRYANDDRDVISKSETKYTSDKDPRRETTNTKGYKRGNSFDTNLKFEWTPDSLTKIVFRPSFQYNTNKNYENSDSQTIFDNDPTGNNDVISNYFSDGSGYKINGNLDLSRKLNDKGRVVSLGLRGGYNSTESDGYDYNQTDYTAFTDSTIIIDNRFFQDDNSYNWRAFLSYVEPLGRNNFLELSYNISNNSSKKDKQAYYNNNLPHLDPSYTDIDTAYTRYVKNDFVNQNVSLKFRAAREKYNYMIGLGLEPSSSKTTLREPNKQIDGVPRKTFLSFAPSGQFNYFWDKRHNIRVDYSGTTNQPTTLQLYNGIYSRDGMNTTSGNPNLKPSFQNRLNIRYRKFNPEQASFMMLFGRFSHTSNDIVTTSTLNAQRGRDVTYNNVSGNMDGSLRFIFNRPLRNRNWSINSMSFVGYNINNTIIDSEKNKGKRLDLHENAGIQFKSAIIDFGLRGNVRYENLRNTINTRNNRNTTNYGGVFDFTLYLPWNITIDSDINYSANSGMSQGFKQDEWLWNASISKLVFKNKAGTIRLKMYDILQERSNISRTYAADYVRDITRNTLSSYFMAHFVYRFQIFKGGAKAGDMSMGDRGMRGHGGGRGRPH